MMKLEQATSLIDELEKCRKDNWHSLPPSLIAYQETVDEPNPEKSMLWCFKGAASATYPDLGRALTRFSFFPNPPCACNSLQ
jgi:hypothetical protein